MTAEWKVLVVEDKIPVAMMMVAALTHAGLDVTTACNGRKGLELSTTRKFDLITLEVDLPDISGFAICSELKQRHISHNTPIIFISERLGESDRRCGLELGAADFIAKPFGGEEFVRCLLSHIKQTEVPV
jgi:DNA-binding response OmpR family regulator